jgi:hypothetical protein
MHRLRAVVVILLAQSLTMTGIAQQWGPAVRPGATVHVNAFATIQGNALTATNAPLVDAVVRLRDCRNGRIVDTTRTDQAGLFVFRPVEPGSYVVELVGAEQRVLAASELLNVNAYETLSAIVRLPAGIEPYAGVLGHKTMSAILVIATAAATGVLAAQVSGDPVSPRR